MRIGWLLLPLVSCAALAGACGTHSPSAGERFVAPVEAPSRPEGLTAKEVDEVIRDAWQKEGITPARPVDDARFFRRASLDITGVIPTEEATQAFLVDKAPDKRRRAIEALLASPGWASQWTNYFDRLLLGREVRGQLIDRDGFREWLHGRFAKNTPYDRLVFDLITAEGVTRPAGEGPMGGGAGMQPAGMGGMANGGSAGDLPVNGAVSFLVKFDKTPQDLAGTASRVFLGVQIQCAQCHDHKTEKWKQSDFRSFASCFAETRIRPVGPPAMGGKLRQVEVSDEGHVAFRKKVRQDPEIKSIADARPAALDGTDFSRADNPRKALAEWMIAPENPWFAKAAVNRVWAHFLGRGFVDPITDFRPGNPVTLPNLLDRLAADFVAGGYDMKRLVRLITSTEAYQRAAASKGEAGDDKLWSRFRLEALGPDELLDSLVVATKADVVLDKKAAKNRIDEVRRQLSKRLTFLFDVDEEQDSADFDGSVSQALFLLNGGFVNENTRAVPGSAVSEVLDLPGGDAEKIRSLYRRALSREPTAAETKVWVKALSEPVAGKNKREAKKAALEDLFWALLNSSEFTFNH